MTDFNQNIHEAKDLLNLEDRDIAKLPQGLNVLTILTYIGCALGTISAIYNYFTISYSYKMMETVNTSAEAPAGSDNKMVQSILSGSADIIRKQYENRHIIFALGLTGIALCFYGAMQMRNLKKQGYLLYVIGELMPLVSLVFFVGVGGLMGGISMVFGTLVAAVFIILYTTQRKSLIN